MQWIQLFFFKMNVMRHFIVLVLFALVNINAYFHRASINDAFERKNIISNKEIMDVSAAKNNIKGGTVLRTFDGIEISPDNEARLFFIDDEPLGNREQSCPKFLVVEAWKVYDRMGRLVMRQWGEHARLSSLRIGSYIVRARSGEGVATLTVIRE